MKAAAHAARLQQAAQAYQQAKDDVAAAQQALAEAIVGGQHDVGRRPPRASWLILSGLSPQIEDVTEGPGGRLSQGYICGLNTPPRRLPQRDW